jgi:hypothetical protein
MLNRSPEVFGPACATASSCNIEKHVWQDKIAARFTCPGIVLQQRTEATQPRSASDQIGWTRVNHTVDHPRLIEGVDK